MKIFVRVDRVYGKIVVYPVCEKAKLLAEIAGSKTLTHKSLALAERMGFEIVQSPVVASCQPEVAAMCDPSGALRAAGLLRVEGR